MKTGSHEVAVVPGEELRLLGEASPQQVWTATVEGKLDFVNGRVLEYFGADSETLTANGGLDVVHPDDCQMVEHRWREALITGDPCEVEFRLRRARDGSYLWHIGRAVPLRDAEGRILKWFGTNTDISARKAAEEERDRALLAERELRAQEERASRHWAFLAEASERLGSTLDYGTTLLNLAKLAVPTLADWCGVDVLLEDGSVHPIATAHADPDKLEVAERLRRTYPVLPDAKGGVAQVIRTGQAALYAKITPAILRESARDARHLEALESLGLHSAMILPLTVSGRTFGALTLVLTGTAREFNETDLAFAQNLASRAALSVEHARLFNELEKANQAKDHFLAVLSHELRTPLTPVLMAASAIETDPTIPTELRADVSMIRRNVELEARLIDDLLDLTRISNGKLQLQPQCVDVHELLDHALQIVGSEAAADRPKVLVAMKASAHHVQGDPARLQQIFWNLLKNAVKFTPASGEVHIDTSNPDPQTWQLQVADTGKGISQGALSLIFKAFEQGGREVSHRFGGLGLGLAISKALADLHQGELTAESGGLDHGATFTLRLRTREAPAESPKPRPERGPAPGAGLRILLVEDHETTGVLMLRLLTKRGYLPQLARTKAEGLALAAGNPFDVVISDLGLPDGTGFELMRELKQRHGLTGIALSGYGMETDVAMSEDSGFALHLTKPVDVERLDTALRSISRPAR
ncbi:MAG: sensor hybrid histidine kinase [Chthoniobacter sp.]|nr:sensor hybrid histidine kinase [Chthoniobacter sp.]